MFLCPVSAIFPYPALSNPNFCYPLDLRVFYRLKSKYPRTTLRLKTDDDCLRELRHSPAYAYQSKV